MSVVLSVLFAIGAALCNALATVLKRHAALTVPRSQGLRWRLILDLLHRPVWLGGMLAVVAAAVCQAVALANGALSVVQPIFVLELPLALVIGGFVLRRRLPGRGWAAVACIAGGLGVALAAASPAGNRTDASMGRWIPALAVCCGMMALLSAGAVRRPEGPMRAAFLGTAAAIGYALTAALMKTATSALAERGPMAFVTSWQTYAFAAAGVTALFLLENAMQAGSLVASQPALTLGDALISLSLGVTLYDERIRTGWWLVPEILGAGLVLAGLVGLARIPAAPSLVAAARQAPAAEPARSPVRR